MRVEIHIHHHDLRAAEILSALGVLIQKVSEMSAELDALSAEVTNATTVEQSAITLIQGLKAQLDAAGTDPVALKALSDSLGASDSALAAAVAANTPAASAP